MPVHVRISVSQQMLSTLSRISSVSRAFDCRAGGCRFESQDQTNTQGLKMTEKLPCKWLDLRMARMTT